MERPKGWWMHIIRDPRGYFEEPVLLCWECRNGMQLGISKGMTLSISKRMRLSISKGMILAISEGTRRGISSKGMEDVVVQRDG